MKIFCDLDGVLRYKIPNWKKIKKELTIKTYLKLARPIEHNIKFIQKLSVDYDIIIATKSKYDLANLIWLQKNGLDYLDYVKTSKDKVGFLEKNYCIKGNILIDDDLSDIKKWRGLGGIGMLIENHESIEEKIRKEFDYFK